jgi:hypothetical protein
MKNRPILTACSLGLTLALLVFAGCASAPSPEGAQDSVAYQPVPSPTRIDASASVEATHDLAPAVRASWKARGRNDQAIELHRQAVAAALSADIENSGLFARIVPPTSSAPPDFMLKIRSETVRSPDLRLRVTISVLNGANGAEVCLHMREASLGIGRSPDLAMSVVMPGLMAELKAAVAADIQPKVRAHAELTEIASLRNAGLADLLVSSDSTESIARERNRAIIAAKIQQLPAMLREKKTDELSALVVKIEQTMLDLNHECEVAKDQAQQSVADNGIPRDTADITRARGQAAAGMRAHDLDELRGLAISYRERIELLKPISAALKEEIANRNR